MKASRVGLGHTYIGLTGRVGADPEMTDPWPTLGLAPAPDPPPLGGYLFLARPTPYSPTKPRGWGSASASPQNSS